MKTRKFGSLNQKVSVIGQGSWNFPEKGHAAEIAKKALIRGVQLGMVHIDTAEMYGDAEVVIGEAIEDLPRKDLFIVSKVLPSNASYKGTIKACEKSLKRLKTDYLDCYLLHWRAAKKLDETMKAFEELQDTGKILSFGVSNFDVKDLKEALPLLKKHKIVCNQVLYNLRERGIERHLIDFCESQDIAVVAYTPFGEKPRKGTHAFNALERIALKHKVTVMQLILAFGIRNENLFTIPKASSFEHVEENAGAASIELDKEDLNVIEQYYPKPDHDQPLSIL